MYHKVWLDKTENLDAIRCQITAAMYKENKTDAIDDFSSKKREIYNSIITDNDEHQTIEIINSREKDDVVEVLKLFTNAETVIRGFSLTLSEALPNAKTNSR